MAEKVSATVERLASAGRRAERRRRASAQATICRMQVRTGADPVIEALAWEREPHPGAPHRRLRRPRRRFVQPRLRRRGGIGTLMLLSGPENPTTLNFLPDTHIVMVKADDIAGDYETVWQRIRELYGPGKLPRTVNLVTGPSRSADIEQTLILGAHGPRALHILIVG